MNIIRWRKLKSKKPSLKFAVREEMRIKSFVEFDKNQKSSLQPVEVEIALWPGLPQIHFLGLADSHLKESSLRIKSAIKSAGFKFPVAQQIVVNLRPTHIKKSSKGLELAVALGYLLLSEQIPERSTLDLTAYGELSLNGEVFDPQSEISEFDVTGVWLTGQGENRHSHRPFRIGHLNELKEGFGIQDCEEKSAETLELLRPELGLNLYFSDREAELIKILALGGHHALLAGPSGSGKSNVAKCLPSFMTPPTQQEIAQIQEIHHELQWRPLVAPHSSTPIHSLVGGGSPPQAGDLARSHLGILLLEELLEFKNGVIDALRDPIENELIRVGRLGHVATFKADSQIVATTNLCPCGRYVPGTRSGQTMCRFSLSRCRSYSQRLSGPLLDRFQVLYFSKKGEERRHLGHDILLEIEKARAWKAELKSGDAQVLNRKLAEPAIGSTRLPFSFESERRRMATLRVARTLADLQIKTEINLQDLNRACDWTQRPFQKMEALFD
jgi:magnesium chelatase family protein